MFFNTLARNKSFVHIFYENKHWIVVKYVFSTLSSRINNFKTQQVHSKFVIVWTLNTIITVIFKSLWKQVTSFFPRE